MEIKDSYYVDCISETGLSVINYAPNSFNELSQYKKRNLIDVEDFIDVDDFNKTFSDKPKIKYTLSEKGIVFLILFLVTIIAFYLQLNYGN